MLLQTWLIELHVIQILVGQDRLEAMLFVETGRINIVTHTRVSVQRVEVTWDWRSCDWLVKEVEIRKEEEGRERGGWKKVKSYYKSSSVCLFVCLFVPLLLRDPLTDLRQTWWVYVGGPRNCPWGVLFWKGQRVNRSKVTFFWASDQTLYYMIADDTRLRPHRCKSEQKAHKSLICLDGYTLLVK